MKKMLAVLIIILSAVQVYAAPPKSAAGLWVATKDDAVYWLRLKGASADPVTLIEDLDGSLTTRLVGPVSATETATTEIPVTGQYLPASRTVILNIGAPGRGRRHAIGTCGDNQGYPMELKVFSVLPATGVSFERNLSFWFRAQPKPTR